jgi:hypothetical protein
MKTNLFWREFGGVHPVLLAALIGVIAAVVMRRADPVRRFGAACSAIFQSAGIVPPDPAAASGVLNTRWLCRCRADRLRP